MKTTINRFALFVVTCFFLYSCGKSTTTNQQTTDSTKTTVVTDTVKQTNVVTVDKEAEFKKCLDVVYNALKSKKLKEINQFIHPDYGLFTLTNPGVFYAATHSKSVEPEFMENYLYSVSAKLCNEVKSEKIAVYDCDKGWNKKGCFVEDVTGIDKMSKIIKDEKDMTGEDPAKDKVEAGKKSDAVISRLFNTTECNVELYFSFINDKWYIICINLISPCEA